MAGSQCADLPSFLPAHLKVINESGVTPSFIHHGEKVTAFPDAVAGGNSNTEDIEYKAALESYEAFNPSSAAVVIDDFGIPSDAIQQAQSGDIGLSKFVNDYSCTGWVECLVRHDIKAWGLPLATSP